MTEHGEYYRRRMEEELIAAERSMDSSVAQIHRALADGYRRMIEEQPSADTGLVGAH